jgi:DNA (cytosine-5)-methyltransferase 1
MTTETQQGASNVDIRAGNILSICSGIGGLDLGVHMASEDARTICYVEREAFAIASLVEAMEAGRLDQAPVWTDLRTFDGKAWRGVVDTIIGGIPCTPHSIAGLQRGEDDERDLWPDTARIIADVQPGRVFLENVPGIAPYYFERIGPDLRAMGYSVETGLFSASEVGASHQRQRFFILAHRNVADNNSRGRRENGIARGLGEMDEREADLSISTQERHSCRGVGQFSAIPLFAPFRNDTEGWSRLLSEMPQAEPAFCGASYGSSNGVFLNEDRVDRLRSLGNMVVPLTGALAFATLSRRAKE